VSNLTPMLATCSTNYIFGNFITLQLRGRVPATKFRFIAPARPYVISQRARMHTHC
jgi:hypothetical protein